MEMNVLHSECCTRLTGEKQAVTFFSLQAVVFFLEGFYWQTARDFPHTRARAHTQALSQSTKHCIMWTHYCRIVLTLNMHVFILH